MKIEEVLFSNAATYNAQQHLGNTYYSDVDVKLHTTINYSSQSNQPQVLAMIPLLR